MLERPDLPDDLIIACLRDQYALAVTGLEFLPIGNDSSAWVYRVDVRAGGPYFLKLKHGALYEPAVIVPRFLKDSGIAQVVAPWPTQTQALWATLGDYNVILTPFIDGGNGHEVGLSDAHWIEYGAVLKRIHTTRLPPALRAQVPHEIFAPRPRWLNAIDTVEHRIDSGDTRDNPQQAAMAAFWREKRSEIKEIVAHTEALGRALQQQAPPLVICHADIHIFNLLIDHDRRMHIVDWDETLLAPIERDLMFIGGVANRETALFYQGYGETEVDPLALAFYHHEWCVQEFGDYGERVFLTADGGEATREDAVRSFIELFEPGDVVDAAYRSG